MLLRSYSAPILNSWISSRSRESSPESHVAKHSRNRSMSFAFEDHHPRNHNSHRTSGPDVRDRNPTPPNKKTSAKPPATPKPPGRIKDCGDQNSSKRLLSNSGLGEDVTAGRVEVADNDRVLVVMGGGDGGGGRRSDGGYGYDSYDPDHGSGHDDTDDYYQKMIEENPGSSLLLANYAKFLKEVKGDYGKAEEYCERAILGNRSECDGNVKCLYGDLIWKNQKDAGRAHIYFDEALKTDPNDCYVLASYARFLWDAEEDGQEGEEEENADNRLKNSSKSPGKFFEGSSHQSPITAVP